MLLFSWLSPIGYVFPLPMNLVVSMRMSITARVTAVTATMTFCFRDILPVSFRFVSMINCSFIYKILVLTIYTRSR